MADPTRRTRVRRRVLFLIGQLGIGGSEGQLRLLLGHLDRDAWEAHVVVYHPSPNADHVSQLHEIGVGISSMPESFRGPFGKLVFTCRIARQIRPDVIHSWTVHDNPYAAWAGRMSGTTVRWGSLRSSTLLPGFQSLPRWYQRHALRSVQKIIVNSEALGRELQGHGLSRERMLVLRNCVEARRETAQQKAAPDLAELGVEAGHPVFGCVGNIRRVKNQALFVRAMARVAGDHPEARGVIIGETLKGEETTRLELEEAIDRLGLAGKIALVGFRRDVPEILRGLVALCMTSDSEGMPNVVLEAMAAGVPVIATAVGGVPDVVRDGVTGILVDVGDEEAVAEAMRRVLEAPDTTRRMAEAGKQFALEALGCTAMVEKLERAYEEALKSAERA